MLAVYIADVDRRLPKQLPNIFVRAVQIVVELYSTLSAYELLMSVIFRQMFVFGEEKRHENAVRFLKLSLFLAIDLSMQSVKIFMTLLFVSIERFIFCCF